MTFGENNMAEVQAGQPHHAEGRRSAWILTGYGIFGLAILSVIAYSVAQYAVR